MATRVILHLLGYNCNMYAGIGDQLKTLNVHVLDPAYADDIVLWCNSYRET